MEVLSLMPKSDSATALSIVKNALEDMKSQEMMVLNVRDITSVTDYMIIVSGSSTQHLKAMVNHVRTEAKQHNIEVLGTEGEDTAEWILLDLGDVIVHAMLPSIRDYYQLEKLWSVEPVEATA
ncbi:MAG: rsfS [Gammaproteobacteria bacterium]|jgi:ribosome-associated protein|nr:rsfS [Gammaproteobacteria bacterium]